MNILETIGIDVSKLVVDVKIHSNQYFSQFENSNKGFKKIRHFGYLSSRNKKLLSVLQYLFGTVEAEPVDESDPESKVPHCSICGKPMILIEIVGRGGFDVRKPIPESAAKPP